MLANTRVYKAYEESDEAEISADSHPDWCKRVLDETQRQIDYRDTQSEPICLASDSAFDSE